jgi:hypothetical protein
MMRRLMLMVVLVLGCAGTTAAEPRTQKPPQSGAPVRQQPFLHIYFAKGEANACGEGCSEWIAVEGRFDRDAAARVNAVLRGHAARRLPVYFQSLGGSGTAAIAIGRQLRRLGFTTGVAATIPRGCTSAQDTSVPCQVAKRSSSPVAAEWRPDANCSSACVWALIGGKVRHVPPSARLGVHSGKLMVTRKYPDGRVQLLTEKQVAVAYKGKAAEIDAQTRRYIKDMGVDDALMDAALKVPHESVHYLTRNEIAGYGIDRREFLETPWILIELPSNAVRVQKWIVVARGADRKDYRPSLFALACSTSQWEHARLLHSRGIGDGGQSVTATVSIGSHKAVLSLLGRLTSQQNMLDPGSSASVNNVPFDQVETAAAAGAINVVETDPFDPEAPPRVYDLSTQGLVEGLAMLRNKCMPTRR